MRKIITKKDLYSKLEKLLGEYEIIGPKKLSNKGIFYQSLNKLNDLYLGEDFAIEPIKKIFLKPSECIFKQKFDSDNYTLEEKPLPTDKRIVIGIRPCEAKGLTLLDKVFGFSSVSGSTLSGIEQVDSEYKDEFYVNNRERTINIGLACNKPDKNCFCISMGGSPIGTTGMDALLFDAGDSFIIELITDRGKKIFGIVGENLSKNDEESWEKEKDKKGKAVKRNIKVPDTLDEVFENNYWEDVSKACISCGICTYLCPTCHCFDLVDENREKLRCYDGCAFPNFTLEASGVNPRLTKKERYRQRVFHKFDYFKKNFGDNLCVGCGRCIRHCPVKIDIAEIVNNIPTTSNE